MRNLVYKTTVKDSEKGYFSDITLGYNDLVQDGGRIVKVSTYLKKHGKDGVIALLPYYDLEDEILEEYHIHLQTPADRARRDKEKLAKKETNQVDNAQDCTSVAAPEEDVFESTATEDEDDYMTSGVDEEDYMDSVLYDPEDEPWDSSSSFYEETGWRNHPFGGVSVGTFRKRTYKR